MAGIFRAMKAGVKAVIETAVGAVDDVGSAFADSNERYGDDQQWQPWDAQATARPASGIQLSYAAVAAGPASPPHSVHNSSASSQSSHGGKGHGGAKQSKPKHGEKKQTPP